MENSYHRPVRPACLVSVDLQSKGISNTMVHAYQDTTKLKECMENAEDYHALENCLMEMVLTGKIRQTLIKNDDVGLVLTVTRFDLPNPITLARFRFCMVLFDKEICVLEESVLKVVSHQEVPTHSYIQTKEV